MNLIGIKEEENIIHSYLILPPMQDPLFFLSALWMNDKALQLNLSIIEGVYCYNFMNRQNT